MLALAGVTKSFGGRRVLDDLNLALEPGESVALIGANGTGKTTALRCIVGLARPDRGSIRVDGIDMALQPEKARARLSYLPQRPSFPATQTVRETLEIVARLRGSCRTAVDREITACELEPLVDRFVGELSGGERQRLAIAVALLADVGLYLFDEPSASLDPLACRLLFERARQLTRDGRTLLFTTHIPADVRHLARRVVLLHGGRIESEAAGEFELRRCERILEKFVWGYDDENVGGDDDRGGVRGGARLLDAFPRAGAGSARSR